MNGVIALIKGTPRNFPARVPSYDDTPRPLSINQEVGPHQTQNLSVP